MMLPKIDLNIYTPVISLRAETTESAKTVKNEPTGLSSFRKFVAENAPALTLEEKTLTDQLKAGILQKRIANREIDPNTLIHQAVIEEASSDVFRYLLSHGADVNFQNEQGSSPLVRAMVERRSAAVVRVLLENGANPNIRPDLKLLDYCLSDDWYHFREYNNLEKVELLIEYGADQNYETYPTRDVFRRILWSGLILHNPYVHYVDNKRIYVDSDMDLFEQWMKTAKRMIELSGTSPFSYRFSPLTLCNAIGLGPGNAPSRSSLVKLLLEKGADPNQIPPIDQGMPVLFYAIQKKNLDVVKALVEAGADVNRRIPAIDPNKYYWPLAWARAQGTPEITEYLRRKGAKD